jgi:uncharacterized protein (TIGR03083 family)
MANDRDTGADTLMDMAEAERSDLAAFLGTLTPEQWAAQSLCERWTVKDVVAHVISYDTLTTSRLIARLVKGYFVRSNQIGVAELMPLSPRELLDLLANHLRPRGLTAGFGGMIGLVDGTIHHQDIRRALGQPRTIPNDRLLAVLDAVPPNPRLGAWRLIRGLRLRATDIDWTHGSGDEVVGTGEALLMSITGRRSAVDELTGPGQATLASRL